MYTSLYVLDIYVIYKYLYISILFFLYSFYSFIPKLFFFSCFFLLSREIDITRDSLENRRCSRDAKASKTSLNTPRMHLYGQEATWVAPALFKSIVEAFRQSTLGVCKTTYPLKKL